MTNDRYFSSFARVKDSDGKESPGPVGLQLLSSVPADRICQSGLASIKVARIFEDGDEWCVYALHQLLPLSQDGIARGRTYAYWDGVGLDTGLDEYYLPFAAVPETRGEFQAITVSERGQERLLRLTVSEGGDKATWTVSSRPGCFEDRCDDNQDNGTFSFECKR